jgi:hypothetical protein
MEQHFFGRPLTGGVAQQRLRLGEAGQVAVQLGGLLAQQRQRVTAFGN